MLSSAEISQQRIYNLSQVLVKEGIDAYFSCTSESMGYLHHFFEEGRDRLTLLAVHCNGSSQLICPALSRVQAERMGVKNIFSWEDHQDPIELIRQLEENWNLRTGLIAVDDYMPASYLLEIQRIFPAALFLKGTSLLSQLTAIKDAQEQAALKKASEIADQAFETVCKQLKVGQTEVEIRNLINNAMQDLGGEPHFAIIAAGPGSAEPHHICDEICTKEGEILLMDFGCKYQEYCSDVTRIVCFGPPHPEIQKAYKIVYEAHQAARAMIKPGVLACDIDKAARKVIIDAGFGSNFTHRTGHGVGMSLHEDPYIQADNLTPLEVGNYFSIEPGIYFPNHFGIRIENLIMVTETGYESYNQEPTSEIIQIH